LASERSITPSSSTFSALALSVAPVVDVDDQLRLSGRRRALGRAQTFDDAIVGDAVLGEIAAREIDVFGRDAHALAALRAEGGGDVGEIGHVAHVDPRLRRGDDDIGVAEAERRQQFDLARSVGNGLAHEIFAGHAHVDGALREMRRYVGGREKGDLDIVDALEHAAIIARAAPLHDIEPRTREKGVGVFL